MKDVIEVIATDISACFLALANALAAKGVLTKAELAAAAQERYLALQELLPAGGAEKLSTLRMLTTDLERKPADT